VNANCISRYPSSLGASKLAIALLLSAAGAASGCDAPPTATVTLANEYPVSKNPLVVYDAYWQAVSFRGAAIFPGSSSAAQNTLSCSANTAYVVVAPGWDPTSGAPPASLLVLQSRGDGFGVDLGDALTIPVDDTTFQGNCAAGSPLTQAQADFITQRVFPGDFTNLHYDATTCVTTAIADGGVLEAGGERGVTRSR
jgi:hypothetical protein